MTNKELEKEIYSFVKGLLKKAKCNHAGNCEMMSLVLRPYISVFYGIDTFIINVKVKQGRRMVNHYCLKNVKDETIIDATASQFKFPNGKVMPKIYIGTMPDFYITK